MSKDSRIEGYAKAILELVTAEDALGTVEGELFQVARAVEGNEQLRSTLTDEAIPVARRQGIVAELVDGAVHPVTAAAIDMVLAAGRGRDLPAIVDAFVSDAASARSHQVAEIRTAIPLDDATIKRLEQALSRATGLEIEAQIVVDPAVLGGIQAKVGDRLIDGTIRSRLQQMKAAM